jgi:transcription elongation factor GreA
MLIEKSKGNQLTITISSSVDSFGLQRLIDYIKYLEATSKSKAKQADVEQRVRQLEDILSNANIVNDVTGSSKIVSFGRTIKILHLGNKKEYTFKIVGTHETNPTDGTISNVSPLGEAIMGGKVNDKVTVKAPKSYQVQILKIE